MRKLKVIPHRTGPDEGHTMTAPKTATKTTATAKATATKPRSPRATKPASTKARTVKTVATKPAPAAKTVAAKPAPAVETVAAVTAPVKVADVKATATDTTVESMVCAGPCAATKPVTKFPTTKKNAAGVMGRGKTCRACRDAKKA